jgi:hypothetical protein
MMTELKIDENATSDDIAKMIASLEVLRKAKKANEDAMCAYPMDTDYFFISGVGEVCEAVFMNFDEDVRRVAIGNVYASLEDAEMQLETLKVIAELKRCVGYRPYILGENNYGFYMGTNERLCIYDSCNLLGTTGFAGVLFDSPFNAGKAITQVGEERIVTAMFWYYCKKIS